MKKHIKTILIIAVVILSINCSIGQNDKSKTILNFTAWVNSPDQKKVYEMLCRKFEQKNPDTKIKFIVTPYNGYREKILTLYSGGVAIDVITLNNEMFVPLADKGILMNIDSFLTADQRQAFYPATLKAFQFNNKQMGIPRDFGVFAMFYNKTMFNKVGVDYPPKKGHWTWHQFLSTAKKLTKDTDGDGKPDQYGTLIGTWMPWWAQYVWQNGGNVLSRDLKRCEIASPAAINALKFVKAMIQKYKVSPTISEAFGTIGIGPILEMGKIGMHFIGPWERRQFRKFKYDWDVAPNIMGKKAVTPMFVDGYSMTKKSSNPEKAWKFIDFLTSETGLRRFAQLGYATPARKKIAESKYFLEPEKKPANAKVFLNTINNGRMLPVVPQWEEVTDTINRTLERMLGEAENISVEQGCMRIEKNVNKLLQQ
ncbi:MAG TPA: sugar ABC transporter substrate-binding protein [Spirochaetota bacterium]|nr:sugar ABC transporter substrate-binding protein [Spirochaetota bacterium]